MVQVYLFSAYTDCRAAPRYSKCQIVHSSSFLQQNREQSLGQPDKLLIVSQMQLLDSADPLFFKTEVTYSAQEHSAASGWISTSPQVSGFQDISHDVLMDGWYLGSFLLWKHCLQGVVKFKKKPYEFKMPVLIYECFIFSSDILCNHQNCLLN